MTDAEHPMAVVFVDGDEFCRLYENCDADAFFEETVRRVGGEVALMVWKPRYGVYLRERLTITASVIDGAR
jgi:hypothetical protein